jgi:uncharacterized RDD family membrane protein YckC
MSELNDNVEALFKAAVALETDAQRADYLKRACPDPELRREVESLLAAHRNPDGIFAGKTIRVEPLAFESVSQNVGTVIGGYRIIRPLGKGGMGSVYEAEEIESGRRIALKVLSQTLDSPEARRRFLREGLLAASVNHPNTVYVFGTDEIDGQPLIAMELVSGGTLQERVQPEEPMPAANAVDAILQVIAGLEAAAALGVLHRDIKPSNCFVETDGTVKVGDFGLSISSAMGGELKLTRTGSFLGTPAFSPPEQLRGDEFTLQGDIYAVGVTLYYLLTGRTPFQGGDLVRMLATVLERPAESPAHLRPELPSGLCRAVLRCLEKPPAKRFRNYAGLRNALLPYSSAAPTPATLSLRFLAACIDGTLMAIASMSMVLLVTGHWDAVSHPELYQRTELFFASAFGTLLTLAYYAVLEGRWGASLGKRICGLRVTGSNRGLPGVPRALLRAVIIQVLPTLPSLLFLWLSFFPHPSGAGALKLTGLSYSTFVIMALFFCTARRRNGFAAAQDLLTRTRVIRKSGHEARPGLEAGPIMFWKRLSGPTPGKCCSASTRGCCAKCGSASFQWAPRRWRRLCAAWPESDVCAGSTANDPPGNPGMPMRRCRASRCSACSAGGSPGARSVSGCWTWRRKCPRAPGTNRCLESSNSTGSGSRSMAAPSCWIFRLREPARAWTNQRASRRPASQPPVAAPVLNSF